MWAALPLGCDTRTHTVSSSSPSPPPVIDGLKYAKSHEWAKVDGDTATVGITDFAQVR